jgi:hypothetical protein
MCIINGGVQYKFVVLVFKLRVVSWDSEALRKPATAYALTLAARYHWTDMRILTSFLFVLFTSTTFGQKEVKKAYIFVDGKETTYQEYKTLDLTKFASITVLARNDENRKLFGKKAKHGIVHLRTKEFNDQQKKIIADLKAEFEENRIETTLIMINGIPYDRDQFQKDKIGKIEFGTVEWIVIPEPTELMNHKKVIVIQTNVEI